MIYEKNREPGSLLDLLSVSFPLVLSLVTGTVMIIVDRLFLAHFSTAAMTGSVTANMPIWTVQLSTITLVSIAQVFVGQIQGAGEKKRMAAPIWQMCWVTLVVSFFCLLFAFFGDKVLFTKSPVRAEALTYFRWLMSFSFLPLFIACFSSFFVGKKQTRVVFTSSLAGNLVNVVLNAPLIFGFGTLIPAMGVAGAAIATVVGYAVQCGYLAAVFFSKKNREEHSTDAPTWEPALLKKCLTIGYPTSLDRMISIGGWALFIELISQLGEVSIAVITITQSMMLFFTFISQGIGRAVSSIGANALGASDRQALYRVAISAWKLNTILFCCNSVFFLFFPGKFAELFIPEHVRTAASPLILQLVLQSCLWVWIATYVDSLRWTSMGLLTAVGDTRYMMFVGSTTVWFFCILPTYYFVVNYNVPISYSWAFSGGYYLLVAAIYGWRFRQEKWQRIDTVKAAA